VALPRGCPLVHGFVSVVRRHSYLLPRDHYAVHGLRRAARRDYSGCSRWSIVDHSHLPRWITPRRALVVVSANAPFLPFSSFFSYFSLPLLCANCRGGAGLRYDDLLNEYDPEVRKTIRTMPPEEAELRAKRLTRAIDVDLKKTQLPDPIQAKQDIWNPYIRSRLGALKQSQLERQSE